MKRWILKEGVNNLTALAQEDAPLPEPGPGEVRIQVHAASLNFRDNLVVGNVGGFWRSTCDLVPLADGAGVVHAVGDGVTKWSVGDRVTSVYLRDFPSGAPHPDVGIGLGSLSEQGMLAEYVVLSENRIAHAPRDWSFVEAATIPCAGVTAWNALMGASPIEAGSRVLVLGTGAVSLFALEIAKASGCEVYATTGNVSKLPDLKSLGFDRVFNYSTDQNWGASIFAATQGAHKIVNNAGFGSLNKSLEALAFGGEVAMVGLMTFGDIIDPNIFLGKAAVMRGISAGSLEHQNDLVGFIDQNAFRPTIRETFGFDEAQRAYEANMRSDRLGKVVIDFMK